VGEGGTVTGLWTTLKTTELESLREDSARLAALEAAGVDNWSGYDYAMQLLRENQEDE
jgi:hypothetical protein